MNESCFLTRMLAGIRKRGWRVVAVERSFSRHAPPLPREMCARVLCHLITTACSLWRIDHWKENDKQNRRATPSTGGYRHHGWLTGPKRRPSSSAVALHLFEAWRTSATCTCTRTRSGTRMSEWIKESISMYKRMANGNHKDPVGLYTIHTSKQQRANLKEKVSNNKLQHEPVKEEERKEISPSRKMKGWTALKQT